MKRLPKTTRVRANIIKSKSIKNERCSINEPSVGRGFVIHRRSHETAIKWMPSTNKRIRWKRHIVAIHRLDTSIQPHNYYPPFKDHSIRIQDCMSHATHHHQPNKWAYEQNHHTHVPIKSRPLCSGPRYAKRSNSLPEKINKGKSKIYAPNIEIFSRSSIIALFERILQPLGLL